VALLLLRLPLLWRRLLLLSLPLRTLLLAQMLRLPQMLAGRELRLRAQLTLLLVAEAPRTLAWQSMPRSPYRRQRPQKVPRWCHSESRRQRPKPCSLSKRKTISFVALRSQRQKKATRCRFSVPKLGPHSGLLDPQLHRLELVRWQLQREVLRHNSPR